MYHFMVFQCISDDLSLERCGLLMPIIPEASTDCRLKVAMVPWNEILKDGLADFRDGIHSASYEMEN